MSVPLAPAVDIVPPLTPAALKEAMQNSETTAIVYVWKEGDDNANAEAIARKLANNFLIDSSVHFYSYQYSEATGMKALQSVVHAPLPTFLAISNGEIAQYEYEKVYEDDEDDEDDDDEDDEDEDDEDEEEEEMEVEQDIEVPKEPKVIREEMTDVSVNRFINDYAGTELNVKGGLSTAFGRIPVADRLMKDVKVATAAFYGQMKEQLAGSTNDGRFAKVYLEVLDVLKNKGMDAVWTLVKESRRHLSELRRHNREYEDTLALRNVARAVAKYLKVEEDLLSDEL